MIDFQPMTEDEFAAYKAWGVEDYALDISHNYRISMDEARTNAFKDFNDTLSQGTSTPNHYLYNIVASTGVSESRIGYLWIEVDSQKKRCFIYDIVVHAEFRHQGWGRKTLELLETRMKQQGIQRIGLHVFAKNSAARELYSKLGYELTGLNMQKWLVD